MLEEVRTQFQKIARDKINEGKSLEEAINSAYEFLLKPAPKPKPENETAQRLADDLKMLEGFIVMAESEGSFKGEREALGRILTERMYMLDNLTATQTRCSELIQRCREQTPNNIVEVAQRVLKHSTPSYVNDAEVLAKWVLKYER